MSIAVGNVSPVSGSYAPARPVSYASLLSVGKTGADDDAKNPFSGLIELAPKNASLNRTGASEKAEEAAEAANAEAARKAIRDLQQARMAHEDDSAEKLAAQKACLACKTVDIMV